MSHKNAQQMRPSFIDDPSIGWWSRNKLDESLYTKNLNFVISFNWNKKENNN